MNKMSQPKDFFSKFLEQISTFFYISNKFKVNKVFASNENEKIKFKIDQNKSKSFQQNDPRVIHLPNIFHKKTVQSTIMLFPFYVSFSFLINFFEPEWSKCSFTRRFYLSTKSSTKLFIPFMCFFYFGAYLSGYFTDKKENEIKWIDKKNNN